MCVNAEIKERFGKLKVKQVEICRASECSEAMFSLILTGQRKPSKALEYRILKVLAELEQN